MHLAALRPLDHPRPLLSYVRRDPPRWWMWPLLANSHRRPYMLSHRPRHRPMVPLCSEVSGSRRMVVAGSQRARGELGHAWASVVVRWLGALPSPHPFGTMVRQIQSQHSVAYPHPTKVGQIHSDIPPHQRRLRGLEFFGVGILAITSPGDSHRAVPSSATTRHPGRWLPLASWLVADDAVRIHSKT